MSGLVRERRPLRLGVLAALGLAAAWFGFRLGPDAIGLYRLAFPGDNDAAWESKVGWRLCNGAIAA